MTDPRSPVSEIMSRHVVSVGEKLTLRSLAAVLAEVDVGVALVMQRDESIGVVSERDVVRALADDADPEEVWAADVAVDRIVYAEPHETVLDVVEQMSAQDVRHVVVVDHGTITGVVSARDVLPVLAAHARAAG